MTIKYVKVQEYDKCVIALDNGKLGIIRAQPTTGDTKVIKL